MEINLLNRYEKVEVGDLVEYSNTKCFIVRDSSVVYFVNAINFGVESIGYETIEELVSKCKCRVLAKNKDLVLTVKNR